MTFGVYHRDIKPENFIVTDSTDTFDRRVVVVKLTDFGLSTRESESGDMDCGSAPYMSYECRNNCAPTYSPPCSRCVEFGDCIDQYVRTYVLASSAWIILTTNCWELL